MCMTDLACCFIPGKGKNLGLVRDGPRHRESVIMQDEEFGDTCTKMPGTHQPTVQEEKDLWYAEEKKTDTKQQPIVGEAPGYEQLPPKVLKEGAWTNKMRLSPIPICSSSTRRGFPQSLCEVRIQRIR